MSAARKAAGNSVGEDLDITAGNKAGRTRHWHRQQDRCKLRVSEVLEMAIDNEIGGTRHAHRQLDRWKQRRLPTTRSVAKSSSGNIAVETTWDVGNSVDNNQDQLVNSGINALEIGSEEFGLGIHCLEIFLSHPIFHGEWSSC